MSRRGITLTVVAALAVVILIVVALVQPPRPGAPTRPPAGSTDELVTALGLLPLDGQTPPPFTVETLDGQKLALADLGGRPALLYFWATW